MSRPTINKKAMTGAQRMRRLRAKRKHAVKRDRREAQLAVMALPTQHAARLLETMAAAFSIVVIDPPWPFAVHSRITGLERSAENHYPPMSLAEIEALKIPAAPDCIIGLWTTVPHMANACRILTEVWGFDYVTTITWNKRTKDMAKIRRGLGYVARNTTEHLIIGKRGKIPWAIPGEQWDSGFDAPAVGHSIKPDEPYDFLAEQFAGLPLCEMFARKGRPGWSVWGNEVPSDAA